MNLKKGIIVATFLGILIILPIKNKMGNDSSKQVETPENKPEQIQKDEIPADTQQNNLEIENTGNKDDQGRKNIIIKEKHYEKVRM